MKIYRDDGSFYYYYYKKKKGRKKKRGPKKKKTTSKKERSYDGSWNFKILRFENRKQISYIGKYRTYPEAYKKKIELENENKKVEMPVKYLNTRRRNPNELEVVYEYGIMKKIKEDCESNTSKLRNEYGKLVDHQTTSDKYYLYEKFPCLIEETFWVYGKNPRSDRKTINWIYTNMIDSVLGDSEYIINISLYNNKVVFRYDIEDIGLIICKNIYDSNRVYGFLYDKYQNNKRVIFTGILNGNTERGRNTLDLLCEKTGWLRSKLYKCSTSK